MAEMKIPPAFQLVSDNRCMDASNRMININAIKQGKIKIVCEACCYSSLSFKRIRIQFISLIITLLIFAVGSQSAFSQCEGLCLYEQSVHQTIIPASGENTGYREYTKDYFGSDEMTGPNRDLSVADIQGVSSKHNSDMFGSDRISVYQGLSDEFALNETDSNGAASEYSDGSMYASNETATHPNPAASDPKDWEFVVAPYLWMSSLKGDITVKGIQSHVDLGFIDALKHLDFAFAFHGEVWWKGKLGIFVDPYYARLSDNQEVELPDFNINAKLTATTWIVEFGGLYRVGAWPIGSPYNNFVQKTNPIVVLELLAGGRYWRLKNEIDIEGSRGVLPSEVDVTKNWVDPFIGGRIRLELAKKLFLQVRADIGGFGIVSDFTANIYPSIAYELSWHGVGIDPFVGYKALYVNYDTGSGNDQFQYKTWMYGPLLGVAFRF